MESLDTSRPAASSATDGRPPIALAETCRVVGDRVPLWPLHRERLAEGGCGELVIAQIERVLAEAIAGYEGERTSRLRAHLEVGTDGEICVDVERRLSSLDVVRGPRLAEVRIRDLGQAPPLPQGAAKPADRSWWDAAARDARRRRAHQAVLVDPDGFVVDGSSATVWAVAGDEIVTPPSPAAIAGVARRFVLAGAPDSGLSARVGPLRWRDIEEADEVFLTNAFGGAVAVRDRGGPVTDRVRAMFAEVWRRDDKERQPTGTWPRREAP